MNIKICSKCGRIGLDQYDFGLYWKGRDNKYRYFNICKNCRAIACKDWKDRNDDKVKSYRVEYRKNNIDKVKRAYRIWYEKNKSKRKKYNRISNTTCRVCGKSMYITPSRIKKYGSRCINCRFKELDENELERRNKISITMIEKDLTGENNPAWRGGITKDKYCVLWRDKEYKEDITKRDGGICLNPYCLGKINILNIHHIDYNKKNCAPSNLITLCKSCNSLANSDRGWHKQWYQTIMNRRYGYDFT